MAILTAILSPADERRSEYHRVLQEMGKRVLPSSQFSEDAVHFAQNRSVLIAVHGRRDNVVQEETGVLVGIVRETPSSDQDDWPAIGGTVPDGSLVLIRSDGNVLEAATDFAGSKSAWHARLKCGGIAVSTCFEVVLALLGDLQLDDKALGWFLSSGSTGPRRSWDRRIKPLPRNSLLHGEIDAGKVTSRVSRVVRDKVSLPTFDDLSLRDEIETVLSGYNLDRSPWLLALSGGYDSRAILYGTRHIEDMTCVTWADEAVAEEPESDVVIARQLAKSAGRKHEVKVMKRPGTPADIERSLQRFARYSDGRSDNVLAYLDGMSVWDEIGAGAAGGLLRGDELFGSSIALSASRIRHNMRLDTFEDYADSPEQRDLARRHPHRCPSGLLRKNGETISHWRLRLRADHEIPVVYASLNAVRSRFIESCCPLLDRRLVRAATSIASHHLDERAMYVKAVGSMYPDVPIARSRSTLDLGSFFRFPAVAELVLEHLQTEFARASLGALCIKSSERMAMDLKNISAQSTIAKGTLLGRYATMPLWLKRLKRRLDPPVQLNVFEVAFRSYLASIVIDEMTESARIGSRSVRNQDRAIA